MSRLSRQQQLCTPQFGFTCLYTVYDYNSYIFPIRPIFDKRGNTDQR